MSTLTSLKNMLSTADEPHNNSFGNTTRYDIQRGKQMRKAMEAADTEIQLIDDEPFPANENPSKQIDDVCALLSEDLADALKDDFPEFDGQTPEMTTPIEDRNSPRILEIRRKQKACTDLKSEIRESANALNGLAKHADLITSYLEKTEVELAQLEDLEKHSNKLRDSSVELARKTQEMKATIEELKKQISLLESQKIANRDLIEEKKSEIARLTEENRVYEAGNISRDATIAETNNEKLALLEKIELHTSQSEEQQAENDGLRTELRAAMHAVQQREMEMAKSSIEISKLTEINERHAFDLSEIRSKYAALNSKFLDQKAHLDEKEFELEATKNEYEERLRLKEKRVLEVESKFEVSSRQLALGEEMIASLTHKPESRKLEAEEFLDEIEDEDEIEDRIEPKKKAAVACETRGPKKTSKPKAAATKK